VVSSVAAVGGAIAAVIGLKAARQQAETAA